MSREKKKATEEKLREIYRGDECVLECVELLKELAEQAVHVEELLQRREEAIIQNSEQRKWERELEIFQGESLVVKKSKFIAHCAVVNCVGFLPFLFHICVPSSTPNLVQYKNLLQSPPGFPLGVPSFLICFPSR